MNCLYSLVGFVVSVLLFMIVSQYKIAQWTDSPSNVSVGTSARTSDLSIVKDDTFFNDPICTSGVQDDTLNWNADSSSSPISVVNFQTVVKQAEERVNCSMDKLSARLHDELNRNFVTTTDLTSKKFKGIDTSNTSVIDRYTGCDPFIQDATCYVTKANLDTLLPRKDHEIKDTTLGTYCSDYVGIWNQQAATPCTGTGQVCNNINNKCELECVSGKYELDSVPEPVPVPSSAVTYIDNTSSNVSLVRKEDVRCKYMRIPDFDAQRNGSFELQQGNTYIRRVYWNGHDGLQGNWDSRDRDDQNIGTTFKIQVASKRKANERCTHTYECNTGLTCYDNASGNKQCLTPSSADQSCNSSDGSAECGDKACGKKTPNGPEVCCNTDHAANPDPNLGIHWCANKQEGEKCYITDQCIQDHDLYCEGATTPPSVEGTCKKRSFLAYTNSSTELDATSQCTQIDQCPTGKCGTFGPGTDRYCCDAVDNGRCTGIGSGRPCDIDSQCESGECSSSSKRCTNGKGGDTCRSMYKQSTDGISNPVNHHLDCGGSRQCCKKLAGWGNTCATRSDQGDLFEGTSAWNDAWGKCSGQTQKGGDCDGTSSKDCGVEPGTTGNNLQCKSVDDGSTYKCVECGVDGDCGDTTKYCDTSNFTCTSKKPSPYDTKTETFDASTQCTDDSQCKSTKCGTYDNEYGGKDNGDKKYCCETNVKHDETNRCMKLSALSACDESAETSLNLSQCAQHRCGWQDNTTQQCCKNGSYSRGDTRKGLAGSSYWCNDFSNGDSCLHDKQCTSQNCELGTCKPLKPGVYVNGSANPDWASARCTQHGECKSQKCSSYDVTPRYAARIPDISYQGLYCCPTDNLVSQQGDSLCGNLEAGYAAMFSTQCKRPTLGTASRSDEKNSATPHVIQYNVCVGGAGDSCAIDEDCGGVTKCDSTTKLCVHVCPSCPTPSNTFESYQHTDTECCKLNCSNGQKTADGLHCETLCPTVVQQGLGTGFPYETWTMYRSDSTGDFTGLNLPFQPFAGCTQPGGSYEHEFEALQAFQNQGPPCRCVSGVISSGGTDTIDLGDTCQQVRAATEQCTMNADPTCTCPTVPTLTDGSTATLADGSFCDGLHDGTCINHCDRGICTSNDVNSNANRLTEGTRCTQSQQCGAGKCIPDTVGSKGYACNCNMHDQCGQNQMCSATSERCTNLTTSDRQGWTACTHNTRGNGDAQCKLEYGGSSTYADVEMDCGENGVWNQQGESGYWYYKHKCNL